MTHSRHNGFGKSRLWIAILLIWITIPSATRAQQHFTVANFRLLPNDVSAFINVERDLNDEACALIKVVAPADFAFSTPLGIVKRKDEVGEIWLYLPKGTKTLTIKHPEWGVVRDYKLGSPLESHMTYELTLNLPSTTIITELHDTIERIKVDTITIEKKRQLTPIFVSAIATLAMHSNGPSYGIFFTIMRKHGGFVHISSHLQGIGTTIGTCDKEGNYLEQNSSKPYYSGKTRHSNYTLTIGAIHKITHGIRLFEGVGYGKYDTAWQLGSSGDGAYLKNKDFCRNGVAGEVGVLASIGKLCLSASVITIDTKQWQCCLGVGIKIGKNKATSNKKGTAK